METSVTCYRVKKKSSITIIITDLENEKYNTKIPTSESLTTYGTGYYYLKECGLNIVGTQTISEDEHIFVTTK